jgi:tRNA G10  N-methylase Trm11
MSFIYSIFEVVEIGGEKFLKPIEKPGEYFIDESISSILKYTGKTNEIFTRMMINTAYYTQDNTQNIKLLDPVAGKGTTLYEGLIRGFDVFGVEIGDKIVSEAYNYMKKFLETEKYKHTSEIIKISGANKSFSSKKYSFEIARTKEEQKTDKFKHFEIISGNSTYAGLFFKKNLFDIIVGDLPYGVQHGNVTNQKQSSLTRNPAELLEKCMPAWAGVLKPGGAIALAWNSNVLHRDKLVKIFTGCDLMVKDAGAYLGFGHRVDQAILRDIIVACKK